MLDFRKSKFVRSAASAKDFPVDGDPRVVFAGRSNVGKSSTLNALVDNKNFAKVSSVPGKTIFVNLFRTCDKLWLVDLPGYGYAKRSQSEQERFSKLIEGYFAADKGNIARLYLIVDLRHAPTKDDCQMAEWARYYQVPFTVIGNKLDKLRPSQIEPAVALARETLGLKDEVLIPFSAEKKTGRDLLISDIMKAIGE